MTNSNVQAAHRKEQIREIERKSRLAAWNDYISFFVSKSLGLGGLIVGGLDSADPNLIPIGSVRPTWVAAAGLALLTGKSVIQLITAANDALEGKK